MLNDYNASKVAGTPVTFEVWQGDVLIESTEVAVDSNGGYEFETSAVGSMKIHAKAAHWLGQTQIMSLPYTAAVNFSLINGDITNDNRINVLDYIQLKSNYNKINVDGISADLNGDDKVNVLDYIILKMNYNKIGQ